jgi:murein DD-endopeptidase MepM/ murein hydrolase activator NlpD
MTLTYTILSVLIVSIGFLILGWIKKKRILKIIGGFLGLVFILLIALLLIHLGLDDSKENKNNDKQSSIEDETTQEVVATNRQDFSDLGDGATFKFSGGLQDGWATEYVDSIESINIYKSSGEQSIDNSQIFIRYFEASSFLTLSTVDILEQTKTKVGKHDAVRYAIKKKTGVADFASQPDWRNSQHDLIDIRYSTKSPTFFYVFARNPELDMKVFEEFIDSLTFHNDKASYVAPMDKTGQRVTKKPFGKYITPANSPVQPEKFSGYHTGTDFEILTDELDKTIQVKTICGGVLNFKRTASGYGGVVGQDCMLDGQSVIVIYGHLNINSISAEVGKYIRPGAVLGELGANKSSQTDGERKHLHLGIKKGTTVDIRGYVSVESELATWFDPCDPICQ